ncbi:MAG: hypothetical protein OEY51_04730, partial [Cyclobacteriaceae bacterium]|nr:hypothetical protein [Cyclobacteriaceae bacterium]
QYYPGSWDSFSFDPDAPNMLLAVLPNDKTALFRREDFAALDVDKIAGEKKYTFKLKTQEGSVGSLEDLEGLLEGD